MDLFRFAAGLILVFFGKKLYWLFVGMVGFLAGAAIAGYFSQNLPAYGQLAVAILCGIAGVVFALFLQRLAVAIAGGLAAGYICLTILKQFVLSDAVEMALIVIAFIAGAVLAGMLFNLALILFSTLTGALLVSGTLPVSQMVAAISFVVLLILGFVVQMRSMQRTARE